MKTLLGLRSRWIILRKCTQRSAEIIWRVQRITVCWSMPWALGMRWRCVIRSASVPLSAYSM
jgi:hypothetical protein